MYGFFKKGETGSKIINKFFNFSIKKTNHHQHHHHLLYYPIINLLI